METGNSEFNSAAVPVVKDVQAVAFAGFSTCNRGYLITQSLDLLYANGHDFILLIAIWHLIHYPCRYRHLRTSNLFSLSNKQHIHDLPMHRFADMGLSRFPSQGLLHGGNIRSIHR